MLDNRLLLPLVLLLLSCSESEVATPPVPHNKEYSSQDLNNILIKSEKEKRKAERLKKHKDIAIFSEYSNIAETTPTVAKKLVAKATATDSVRSNLAKKHQRLPTAKQIVTRSSTIAQIVNEDVYQPIVLSAQSGQQTKIERGIKREEQEEKTKNFRAGYKIKSNLEAPTNSSDKTPTIFKISLMASLKVSFTNITITCNHSYNPSGKRLTFSCRKFETDDYNTSIYAEILDISGNKGLDGRIVKQKVNVVQSATYAGLQGAVKQIGNQNPIQSAFQSGVSAGIVQPKSTIAQEVIYVQPQPVIIHFLNSF